MKARFGVLLAAFLSAIALAQAPLDDKYFDSNGVRIHYVDTGRGTPVILVHGFTRSIETNWVRTGVVSRLAASHRVIGIDMRGHGKSGKPHAREAYLEDV